MKWSILIPTLNESPYIEGLKRVMDILQPQVAKYPGEIEIRIHDAGRAMPTGTKRNEQVANCASDYFSFVDSDDVPSHHYVDKMMEGINKGVDVVTLCGKMTTNGQSKVDWIIKLGEAYEERGGKYYRWPNHLACFKRELVKHVKFPPIWQGEDYKWSLQIKNLGLLKTEHHISDQIYWYDFRVQTPQPTRRWGTSRAV
jgi:glycosyltransferase involved in cell wall biosynthesis